MIELINLLPQELKQTIFEFDNTFRNIYCGNVFKEELKLKQTFINNKHNFEKEFHNQMEDIFERIFYEFNEGCWANEFGTMSSNFYEDEDCTHNYFTHGYGIKFFLHDHKEVIFFKIIPLHPSAETQRSLEQAIKNKNYDGFICSMKTHLIYNILPYCKPLRSTFCISKQALDKYQYKNVIYIKKGT